MRAGQAHKVRPKIALSGETGWDALIGRQVDEIDEATPALEISRSSPSTCSLLPKIKRRTTAACTQTCAPEPARFSASTTAWGIACSERQRFGYPYRLAPCSASNRYFSRASADAWQLVHCPVATIFPRNGGFVCACGCTTATRWNRFFLPPSSLARRLSLAPCLPSLRTTHTFLYNTQSLIPRSVSQALPIVPSLNSSHHALCSRRRRSPSPRRHRFGPVDQDSFPQHRSPAAGTSDTDDRSPALGFTNVEISSQGALVTADAIINLFDPGAGEHAGSRP